jgi:phosphatidylinositol-4-phosphate 3-kinase
MSMLRELGLLFEEFEDQSIALPLNPSLVITGVELKSCSYFTSNAFPLKLVFKHDEPRADPHCIMFKVGDDLRQDMLTMQLINIMDKMWLKSGLDLKIITFKCLSTGERRGEDHNSPQGSSLHGYNLHDSAENWFSFAILTLPLQ